MEEIKIIEWLSGDGYGYGKSEKIKYHQKNRVYYVDYIPTVILQIFGDFAKGYIINRETYQISKCYIAKDEFTGLFAHDVTLKGATEALRIKLIETMSISDKIHLFCKEFEKGKSYSGHVFLIGIINLPEVVKWAEINLWKKEDCPLTINIQSKSLSKYAKMIMVLM